MVKLMGCFFFAFIFLLATPHRALTHAPSSTSIQQLLSPLSDIHRQFFTVHQLGVKTCCKNLSNHKQFRFRGFRKKLDKLVDFYLPDKCQRLHTSSVWVTPGDIYYLFEGLFYSLWRQKHQTPNHETVLFYPQKCMNGFLLSLPVWDLPWSVLSIWPEANIPVFSCFSRLSWSPAERTWSLLSFLTPEATRSSCELLWFFQSAFCLPVKENVVSCSLLTVL